MSRILGFLILIRGRFDAMAPGEQASALLHLSFDAILLLCLATMIYVGFTADLNAFFVWVPVLGFFVWLRFNRARKRWSL